MARISFATSPEGPNPSVERGIFPQRKPRIDQVLFDAEVFARWAHLADPATQEKLDTLLKDTFEKVSRECLYNYPRDRQSNLTLAEVPAASAGGPNRTAPTTETQGPGMRTPELPLTSRQLSIESGRRPRNTSSHFQLTKIMLMRNSSLAQRSRQAMKTSKTKLSSISTTLLLSRWSKTFSTEKSRWMHTPTRAERSEASIEFLASFYFLV